MSVFDPETMTFRDRLHVPGARTLVADGLGAWVGVAGGSALLRIHHGRVVRAPLGMRSDGYDRRSRQRVACGSWRGTLWWGSTPRAAPS